ncbi:hypothetical protein V1519DRAFT_454801 [Lipomyces tetrasporus]
MVVIFADFLVVIAGTNGEAVSLTLEGKPTSQTLQQSPRRSRRDSESGQHRHRCIRPNRDHSLTGPKTIVNLTTCTHPASTKRHYASARDCRVRGRVRRLLPAIRPESKKSFMHERMKILTKYENKILRECVESEYLWSILHDNYAHPG